MSCTGLPPTCRVDLPRVSTFSDRGGECVDLPGKVGSLQRHTYVTPENVIYYSPGTTLREFNGPSLRLPQKQDFLFPYVFNGGCSTLTTKQPFAPGAPNSATNLSSSSQNFYASQWAPMRLFEGNAASCNCSGIKCDSPNGTVGWMLDKNGNPLWTTR